MIMPGRSFRLVIHVFPFPSPYADAASDFVSTCNQVNLVSLRRSSPSRRSKSSSYTLAAATAASREKRTTIFQSK